MSALALFGVAVLWGSNTPALRYILLLQRPPSPALLTALQTCLAALSILPFTVGAFLEGSVLSKHPPRDASDDEEEGSVYHAEQTSCSNSVNGTARSYGEGSHAKCQVSSHAAPLNSAAGSGQPAGGSAVIKQQHTQGGGASALQASTTAASPGQLHHAPAARTRQGGSLVRTILEHVRGTRRAAYTPVPAAELSVSIASSAGAHIVAASSPSSSPSPTSPNPADVSHGGAAVSPDGTQRHTALPAPAPAAGACPLTPWQAVRCGLQAGAQVLAQLLMWQSRSMVVAGLELGLWNCCAVAAGIAGLQLTSATKAAFLTQATALLTPLLAAAAGQHVQLVVWLACLLGVVGNVTVALDSGRDSSISSGGAAVAQMQRRSSDSVHGQMLVLASALSYSVVTVRLGVYCQSFRSHELATSTTCAQALLSLLWLLTVEVFGAAGGSVHRLSSALAAQVRQVQALAADHTALALLLWCGLGPGALASLLQAHGQRRVLPAQAQVIYATTPIWTALLALALRLQGETMGLLGWLGGALMLLASGLAALASTT
mmetsp:Transcript_6337/g.14015  ORF Transcript_6337/g.14015 Transcript_6337/m.14015 type:complete len:546 (-) Transcript_6337:335-1972(-)